MFAPILAAAGLLSSTAFAQPVDRVPSDAESADELARVGTKELRFETGDELEGEVLRPVSTHIHQRPGLHQPSLIRLRASFADRLFQHTRDM